MSVDGIVYDNDVFDDIAVVDDFFDTDGFYLMMVAFPMLALTKPRVMPASVFVMTSTTALS